MQRMGRMTRIVAVRQEHPLHPHNSPDPLSL
jgi:hypothetical protein